MTSFPHYYFVYVSVKNPFVCCALIAIKVNRKPWSCKWRAHSHQPFELSHEVRTRIKINKAFKIWLTLMKIADGQQ